MEYIACLSYGKDSIVIPELCKRYNLPLDRIVHVEIMADDNTPAQLPEMTEFKKYANDVIEDLYGIKVEVIHPERTFEQNFYRTITSEKSPRKGEIYGFPLPFAGWCTTELKIKAINQLYRVGGTVM